MELPSSSTLTFSFVFYFISHQLDTYLLIFQFYLFANLFSPFSLRFCLSWLVKCLCSVNTWNCLFNSFFQPMSFAWRSEIVNFLNYYLMSTFIPAILFFYWCLILSWTSFACSQRQYSLFFPLASWSQSSFSSVQPSSEVLRMNMCYLVCIYHVSFLFPQF